MNEGRPGGRSSRVTIGGHSNMGFAGATGQVTSNEVLLLGATADATTY
jgi:hypothetical protein